jgi:hypothetical protein
MEKSRAARGGDNPCSDQIIKFREALCRGVFADARALSIHEISIAEQGRFLALPRSRKPRHSKLRAPGFRPDTDAFGASLCVDH